MGCTSLLAPSQSELLYYFSIAVPCNRAAVCQPALSACLQHCGDLAIAACIHPESLTVLKLVEHITFQCNYTQWAYS